MSDSSAARERVIEKRAARMAYDAGFGASEWEAFVAIAEDVLTAEGVIYQWRYGARRAPGTGKPGVWIQSTGPEISRVSDHRTMLGARLKAWRLNRGRGWREAVREQEVAAALAAGSPPEGET